VWHSLTVEQKAIFIFIGFSNQKCCFVMSRNHNKFEKTDVNLVGTNKRHTSCADRIICYLTNDELTFHFITFLIYIVVWQIWTETFSSDALKDSKLQNWQRFIPYNLKKGNEMECKFIICQITYNSVCTGGGNLSSPQTFRTYRDRRQSLQMPWQM
jgi:hypothetical protein